MTGVREAAVEAMLRELRVASVETEELGTFRLDEPTIFNASKAAPILLRWLPMIEDNRVRESIARSLTNEPEARRLGAAAVLVEEFLRDDDDPSTKWAIGNALATLSDAAVAEDLITLLRDKRQGKAREMLCRALKTTGDPRAPAVLIQMIDDDEVAGHAIAALRSFGPVAAMPYLLEAEEKLRDTAARPTSTPFARTQAKRALRQLKAAAG